MKKLAGLFSASAPNARPRLSMDIADIAVYAIGDVHGCLDALLRLEAKIVADAEAFPGRKLIIMLGDYVDRGPASAEVVAHLAGPPPEGFERICLSGNHEMMMLDYLEGRRDLDRWLSVGAASTLVSYGIEPKRLDSVYSRRQDIDTVIRAAVPAEHLEFLRSLPVLVETKDFIFVHAGFRPDIPLDRQSDEDLMTIRGSFLGKAHLLRQTVVHGHTPVRVARLEGRRLNIDTGACFGRRLTAVRIVNGKGRFIQS